MKISNMKSIFDISHLSNESVRMEAVHGIGKSKIVESWAEEKDIHLEILFLSQQEVGDLIGIPENINGFMQWSKPAWLGRMEKAHKDGKHCALFLDELARAPLDVRQASLQLVLEGKIHDHSLPVLDGLKTFIVAADNPSDLYQTDDLDAALLSRFSTYDVEVDVDGWLNWARMSEVLPVITDYIAENSEKLHFQNDKDKGSDPRAWAKLSDLLKNVPNNKKEFTLPIINSKVGELVGASFFHFYNSYMKVLKVQDVVDMVDEIANDRDLFDIDVQKSVARKLSKETKSIEGISASELAQKFKKKIEDGDKSMIEYLVCYLGSLNLETGASINKAWKNQEDNKFFFAFNTAIPKQWLTSRVIEKVN